MVPQDSGARRSYRHAIELLGAQNTTLSAAKAFQYKLAGDTQCITGQSGAGQCYSSSLWCRPC